jgi:hypothetical protein
VPDLLGLATLNEVMEMLCVVLRALELAYVVLEMKIWVGELFSVLVDDKLVVEVLVTPFGAVAETVV